MDEAERCHRLAFIFRGMVLDSGTPDEIVERRNLRGAEIVTRHAARAAVRLRAHPAVDEVSSYGNVLRLMTHDGAEPEAVVREALGGAIELGAIRPVRVGVEDAFVSMVRADAGTEPDGAARGRRDRAEASPS
jgi:ABC-2 type transport system ATP-binding protein